MASQPDWLAFSRQANEEKPDGPRPINEELDELIEDHKEEGENKKKKKKRKKRNKKHKNETAQQPPNANDIVLPTTPLKYKLEDSL